MADSDDEIDVERAAGGAAGALQACAALSLQVVGLASAAQTVAGTGLQARTGASRWVQRPVYCPASAHCVIIKR